MAKNVEAQEDIEPMTVLGLEVHNVLRIKTVRLRPDKIGMIIVGGQNAQGKSSLIDSIWMALNGAKAVKKAVIHKGASKGEIKVDLGPLVVTRKFTQKNEYPGQLEVRTRDGEKVGSPQETLDKLTGLLTFDPTEFLRMDQREQGEALRRLIGIDFAAADAEKASIYEERRKLNAEIRAKKAVMDSVPFDRNLVGREKIDVTELRERIAAVRPAIEARDQAAKDLMTAEKNIMAMEKRVERQQEVVTEKTGKLRLIDDEIKDLEARIHHLRLTQRPAVLTEIEFEKSELASMVGDVKAAESARDEIRIPEDIPDLNDLHSELSAALDLNRRIDENERAATMQGDVNKLDEKAEDMTRAMDEIEDRKREQLASAKYPIEGLAIELDGSVTFNGIPLSNVSTAEGIRISLSVGIAMNPRLNVMLLRHGNDLDDSNIRLVGQLAKENGFQVWVERIANDPAEVSVLIQDGGIAE